MAAKSESVIILKKKTVLILLGILCLALLAGCGGKKPASGSGSFADGPGSVPATPAATPEASGTAEPGPGTEGEGDTEPALTDDSFESTFCGTYVCAGEIGDITVSLIPVDGQIYLKYESVFDYAGAEVEVLNKTGDGSGYRVKLYPFSGFSFAGDYWGEGYERTISAGPDGSIILSDSLPFFGDGSVQMAPAQPEAAGAADPDMPELVGAWRCVRDGEEFYAEFREDGTMTTVRKAESYPPEVLIGTYAAVSENRASAVCEMLGYGSMPYELTVLWDSENRRPVIMPAYDETDPADGLPYEKTRPGDRIEAVGPGPGSRTAELLESWNEYLGIGQEESAEEALAAVFGDIPEGAVYGFFSGAGAWETMLEIRPDGSFTGQFHDSNMGESGEDYYGTIYECVFSGRFSAPERVEPYTYAFTVEELDWPRTYENGETEYIDDEETRHVLAWPYGLSEGADFVAYLPGKEMERMDENCLSWIEWRISALGGELQEKVLYNVSGDAPFTYDEYASVVKKEGGLVPVTEDESGIHGQGKYGYTFIPVETKGDSVTYWGIDVYDEYGNDLHYSIEAVFSEDCLYYPPADQLIVEADVNFDGLLDIVVYDGIFGVKAVRYEKAYIRTGDAFEEVIDYNEIPNPAPYEYDTSIHGSIRVAADSFYDLRYEVQGNRAVMVSEILYQYDEETGDYVIVEG